MSRLPDEFYQDRALRDAARDVLLADIEHARRSLSKDGLTTRFTGRIGDGAKDAIEVAKVHAEDNRGLIAGLIALLALWFARQPLLEIFGFDTTADEQEPAPQGNETPLSDEPDHEIETEEALGDTDQAEPSTTGEIHD